MMSVVLRVFFIKFSTSSERCSSAWVAVALTSPPPLLFSTSWGEVVTSGAFFEPRLNSTTGRTSAEPDLISVRVRYVVRKKAPKATRMP